MPGSTTNTDILEGMNQLIKAVNGLNLSVSVSSCCTDGTDTPVIDDTTGTGNIPDDWEDQTPDLGDPGTPEYDAETCKRANFHFDQLYNVIEQWYQAGVAGLLQFGVLVAIVALKELALAAGIIPATMTKVAGWGTAILVKMLVPGVDMARIQLKLSDNQEAIVCLFYDTIRNGGVVEDVRAELDTILENDGLEDYNRAVVQAIYTLDWALWLIAAPIKEKPSFDAALDAYAGGNINCASCEQQPECPEYTVLIGLDWGGGIVSSSWIGDQWVIEIIINSDNWCGHCEERAQVTLQVLDGSPQNIGDDAWRLYGTDIDNCDLFYSSNTPPSWPVCLRAFDITDNVNGYFRIQISTGDLCN